MAEENIKFSRVWAMPNSLTFSIKPIAELLKEEVDKSKFWIDPFANNSKWASVTNDLNPEMNTDYHLDALDFLKMFKDNSVDGVLYDPPYCYDEKTELLTSKRWKKISEINKEDELATLNLKNFSLEYQNPTEIISRQYDGDMVSIKSQNVSLLVTPNHRCLVKFVFEDNWTWIEAKDLFKNAKFLYFLTSHKNGINLKIENFRKAEVKVSDFSFVDFSGKVYCVSVPNTTVLVKRNGKVFWCGNSLRQVSECYKGVGKEVTQETTQASWRSKHLKEIGRIVKLGGKAICFGWNSSGAGKKYGFEITRILLVPHGGMKNDTIVTVCKKTHEPKEK